MNMSKLTEWEKAIAILKPRTLQAILIHKCYLITIKGYIAVIGITSPRLLRLIQDKVPNIEIALTQVCQRQIRVILVC